MTKGEARLRQDRAVRDSARTALDSQFARVKADIAAKGLAARAAQSVIGESREAAQVGLDVVRERKGVIAGTIGVLLLWLLRRPIVDGITGALARLRGEEPIEDECETQAEEADCEQGQ